MISSQGKLGRNLRKYKGLFMMGPFNLLFLSGKEMSAT